MEEKIVLGYIGHQIHHLLERQSAHIYTSDLYLAAVCLPEGSDQARYRGLAGSGGPYNCCHTAWGRVEADLVQHLGVSIAKRDFPEGDIAVFQRHWFQGAFYLFFLQHASNLLNSGIHHRKTVRVLQCLNERLHKPQRKNDAGDKNRRGQTAALKKPRSQGKHPQKAGGHDGNTRHIKSIGLLEPCRLGRFILFYSVGVFSIGGTALVERLDDFDSADILHNGRIHVLSCGQNPAVPLFIILHHPHIAEQPDGNGDKRNQSNPPVQYKQIQEHQHRD